MLVDIEHPRVHSPWSHTHQLAIASSNAEKGLRDAPYRSTWCIHVMLGFYTRLLVSPFSSISKLLSSYPLLEALHISTREDHTKMYSGSALVEIKDEVELALSS